MKSCSSSFVKEKKEDMYVFTVFKTNVCVPLYSAKGIDDVALDKK